MKSNNPDTPAIRAESGSTTPKEREEQRSAAQGRFWLTALIGPCSREEAEAMVVALASLKTGQRHGAAWSMEDAEDAE